MFIFGVILVLVGLICVSIAVTAKKRVESMSRIPTLPVGQLIAQYNSAVQAGAAGRFRQEAEVCGWATVPPQGPLIAQMSQQPCVWYRNDVRVRYWERLHSSPNSRSQRTWTAAESNSEKIPFGVRDQTGAIFVRPGSTKPEGIEQVVNRFEPHRSDHPILEAFARSAASTLTHVREREIVGFEYREWILRPDAPLFVHGTASDATGQLMFGASEFDDLIMANRSKTDVAAEEASNRKTFAWLGAVLIAIGIVLIVVYTLQHHHH